MNNSNNNHNNSVRGSSVEHAHPLAKRIFARLRFDTRASRRHVLEAILPSLGEPITDRARAALQALRKCQADLGSIPTAHRYAEWRAIDPNPEMWPSKGFIANTFGSWSNATARLSANFDPDLKWTGHGGMSIAYSETDILGAIREWICEFVIETTPGGWSLQHPTFQMPRSIRSIKLPSAKAFFRWSRAHVADGKKRPTRSNTIERVFGTWENAVARANGGGSHNADIRFLIDMSLSARADNAALVMPLLDRAIRMHRDGLSGRRFDAWLEREASTLRGKQRRVAMTFRSIRLVWTFGSWERVLAAAVGEDKVATYTVRGKTAFSRDELGQFARRCAESIGHPPLNGEYVAWRESELKRNDPELRLEAGQRQSIPSAQAFNRFWRKWNEMLDDVFASESS